MLTEMIALSDRVRNLVDAGDRVLMFLEGSVTFQQGATDVKEAVLNVPSDGDYFVEKLNLYAGSRLLTVSSTAAATQQERTFRPCDTSSVNEIQQVMAAQPTRLLDFLFELVTPAGKYQNAPMSALNAFSNRYGVGIGIPSSGSSGPFAYSAWPHGGLVFPAPGLHLPSATALVVRISPTGSRPPPDNPFIREFRVQAVATGYKRVKTFV